MKRPPTARCEMIPQRFNARNVGVIPGRACFAMPPRLMMGGMGRRTRMPVLLDMPNKHGHRSTAAHATQSTHQLSLAGALPGPGRLCERTRRGRRKIFIQPRAQLLPGEEAGFVG